MVKNWYIKDLHIVGHHIVREFVHYCRAVGHKIVHSVVDRFQNQTDHFAVACWCIEVDRIEGLDKKHSVVDQIADSRAEEALVVRLGTLSWQEVRNLKDLLGIGHQRQNCLVDHYSKKNCAENHKADSGGK